MHLSLRLALTAVAVLAHVGCSDPWADVRARLSPADLERFDRGARIAAPCAACHDLSGEAQKIGPHLKRIDGRRAGGLPGFAYSQALERSDLVWTTQTLDAFLAEPQRVVPGNRMVATGVGDAGARGDLVFFLIQAGRSGGD